MSCGTIAVIWVVYSTGFSPSDDGCGVEQSYCVVKRRLVGREVCSEEVSSRTASTQSTPYVPW